MSAVRQSARASEAGSATDLSGIPGDLHGALEDVNVPAYAVDRFGVIRWINSAAKKLVGDVRGKQQSSVVVPEQAREAKESFLRKMMGTEESTDGTVVVVGPDGERVQVEISSCALREGHRIVGVFGVVRHRSKSAPPLPHPHLTPRQYRTRTSRRARTRSCTCSRTVTPPRRSPRSSTSASTPSGTTSGGCCARWVRTRGSKRSRSRIARGFSAATDGLRAQKG